jgi:uncharacterized protein
MNPLLACVALLVLLFAALSLNVSLVRIKRRQDSSITDDDITQAVRTHGNAAEYIPLMVALLLYLNSGTPGVAVLAVAVLVTVSRFAHAVGMLRAPSVNHRNPGRYWGSVGTYTGLFALGVLVLMRAFAG